MDKLKRSIELKIVAITLKQLNRKIFGIILLAIFNSSFINSSLAVLPQTQKEFRNNKNNKDTIITKAGVYLLNPTDKDIDSLKKTMGEDDFYTVADDSNFYISKISSLHKGKLIDIKNQDINFKKEKYLFKKKENKNLWTIIEYNEGRKPEIYTLIDFYNKIQNPSIIKTEEIDNYISNTDYFNVSFDINGDGKDDKIISNKPNTGDNLLVYFFEKGKYKFQLKSSNFSQDGGNQISEIKKTNAGFVIKTNFPDRGFLESEHYIEYKEKKWFLRNTIYKTKSGNQEKAFMYKCDVKQNLDFSDPYILNKVNSIPDEDKREKVCTKEFDKNNDKLKQTYVIKVADGYCNLRKEKNNNSEIIQKINNGEEVNVLYAKDDWWLIETKEKKRGYVIKNNVQIKN